MLLELSYTLGPVIPKWPTNPDEKYEMICSPAKGDPNTASSVYHHTHNGTHVDAPLHFDPNGRSIDQIPIEDFYYTAPYVLNAPKQRGQRVTLEDVVSREQEISRCDILFLYTGYSKLRATDPQAYVDGFPSIAPDAAAYLRKHFPKLKAIALDAISVDDARTCAQENFPTHHALLMTDGEHTERTLLLYEDVNIAALEGHAQIKAVCAFPQRWAGLEGAPTPMVAML